MSWSVVKVQLPLWLCGFVLLAAIAAGFFDALVCLGAWLGDPARGQHKSMLWPWTSLFALGVALWLVLQFASSIVRRLVERLLGIGKPTTFSRTSLVSRLTLLAALPLIVAMAGDWRTIGADAADPLIALGISLILPLLAIGLVLRSGLTVQ